MVANFCALEFAAQASKYEDIQKDVAQKVIGKDAGAVGSVFGFLSELECSQRGSESLYDRNSRGLLRAYGGREPGDCDYGNFKMKVVLSLIALVLLFPCFIHNSCPLLMSGRAFELCHGIHAGATALRPPCHDTDG
jgi:hypothetical protein